MKTITQYKEDIRNLMAKAADIDAKCVAENRDATEAELALKNELLDAVEEIQKIVNAMERQERIQDALQKPNPPATQPGPADKTLKGSGIEVREKDRFSSLGEQISAVMRAGVPNGSVDPRLRVQAAATGLGESVTSDGGFLVQQDYATELLQEVFDTGVLASKVRRRIPISSNANSIKINGVDETSRASTRWGGIKGYWADESEEKTKSKPKFRKIELNLRKLIGLCYATDELLEDAGALEGVIREGFTSEFGFLVDDSMVNGTGANQPLGIMNSGCLVSVGAEAGQAAATIVSENIIKMFARRFAVQTGNYMWFYNQNIEPQLMTMSLAVGTGGVPLYMPPGGLSQSPYGTILGRPAMAIEQAATLGTTGDIILANFADGYVIAEKGGIQSDMSIHVRFIYDESVFRFVMRIDGQPVRASALTPYKGGAGATQSHFVVLDTRS